MNRNVLAGVVATVLVVAVVILGFHALGSPRNQRLIQMDARAVQRLGELAQQINTKWNLSNKTLPVDLESFPKILTEDPLTHEKISYRRKSDTQYELCATFATDSRNMQPPNVNDPSNFWLHSKGNYCFQFDATQQVQPSYYNPFSTIDLENPVLASSISAAEDPRALHSTASP
ncbi:MAG TPA: hypothetical protein VEJ46_14980 [Candidatus Acidoferrum sp.]|nr:hypothetical protein [Candidatus Acidoferrum sp.]